VTTLKKPTFCSSRAVEFSAYSVVVTPVCVLAMMASIRIREPTPCPVLPAPPA